jgi:hypothetical protein
VFVQSDEKSISHPNQKVKENKGGFLCARKEVPLFRFA